MKLFVICIASLVLFLKAYENRPTFKLLAKRLSLKRFTTTVHNVDISTETTSKDRISMPTSTPSSVLFTGTSGAALHYDAVSLSVGNYDIMSNVNWQIMPFERWALVGRNGAGNDKELK